MVPYFQTKKSHFGQISEGLEIESVGIFCDYVFGQFSGQLVYFWYFGTFCDRLIYISPFCYVVLR
jgi:hypothetical protein